MFPADFITMTQKFSHVYEFFCAPVCKKYELTQSAFDVMLFLANNPSYNTARDVCEVRGLKKGIVSVVTEQLVQRGYLVRENDPSDRRIQRLQLTDLSEPIVADGRTAQKKFMSGISAGLSEQELGQYRVITEKIRENIVEIERKLVK